MSRHKALGPLFIAIVVLVAGGSVAAGLTGAEAAKDRMQHMKAMGAASKALFDQLKSGSPDMAVVKVQAGKIAVSSKALPGWFPVGSGQSADPKSKALPVIWTDPAGFQAKATALAAAAAKLDAAAQAGDAAAVGPAFKAVGGACKDCHTKFKAKDEA